MKKIIVLLTAFFLLAACSSSDDDSPAGTPTETGVFKDSNVAGLAYVSGAHSGVTDALGQFIYEVGQPVTFSIGGVAIGTAAGGEIITPVDLVHGGSSSSMQVQNIVRFLMMLDNDGNPDNGITIPAAVQKVAEAWPQVDFSTSDLDSALTAIMSSAIAASGFSHVLPDVSTARTHMEATFRCAYAGAYEGTYSGDDSGNFGIMVDALTGEVDGVVYSNSRDLLMTLTASSPIGYDQKPSFVSGSLSDGSTFQGTFTASGTVSGTWNNSEAGTSGSFSGARVGGELDAAYRFTGQFTGDDYGLIAFDLNSGNAVTGIAYSVLDDSLHTLSGTLSGNTLNVTISGGGTATGTLDISSGEMSGSWSGEDDSSGSFSGCGCKLN